MDKRGGENVSVWKKDRGRETKAEQDKGQKQA